MAVPAGTLASAVVPCSDPNVTVPPSCLARQADDHSPILAGRRDMLASCVRSIEAVHHGPPRELRR